MQQASQSFCITHGLVMRNKQENEQNFTATPMAHTLLPSAFSKSLYQQGAQLSTILNKMIDKMARDLPFLQTHLQHCDAQFTQKLLHIYEQQQQLQQPYMLGIHRYDYMVHQNSTLQQVEMNTIAAGLASCSTIVGKLHQFMMRKYKKHAKANHVISESYERVPKAMALAHAQYISTFNKKHDDASVLFVVQPNERNIADQKHLEHELMDKYGINVIRATLSDLVYQVTSNNELLVQDADTQEWYTISLVYFRSGYTPNDYPTDVEWQHRSMIEHSNAIKCPSIGYHLMTSKKMQQVIGEPGVMEQYLTAEECQQVKQVLTGVYALNEESVHNAVKYPELYVLKPQREGGGNLIHGDQMSVLLQNETGNDTFYRDHILMNKIVPVPVETSCVAFGQVTHGKCVQEIGYFGTYLSNGTTELWNENAGYLLRTKPEHVHDGGVASGKAFIDSIYLL